MRVSLVPLLDRRLESLMPQAGTLVVNVLGCLLIGLGAELLPRGAMRPIVLGGLLGGFTTYSAFGLLTFKLAQDGRYGAFAAQVVVHILVGLAAVGAGLALGKQFMPAGEV